MRYKVIGHDNSKEYYNQIKFDYDTMYIAPTNTFKNMLRKKAKEEDKWRIINIEELTKLIYPKRNDLKKKIELKTKIRLILKELIDRNNNEEIKRELIYFEDNIDFLLSDIIFLIYANVKSLNVSTTNEKRFVIRLIYDKLSELDEFEELFEESTNLSSLRMFYKRLNKGYIGNINKIVFYNINNLDVTRWKIIRLLSKEKFDLEFRIPYFKDLKVVNKAFGDIYLNMKNIFELKSVNKYNDKNYFQYKYISFLEGGKVEGDIEENVITKEYFEVSDFKKILKNKNIITLHKDSIKSLCNREIHEPIEHVYQSTIGNFLNDIYKVELAGDDIKIDFNTYRNLMISGWVENKSYNGNKFSEYFVNSEEYFTNVRTFREILDRIESLKTLKEINEIFEENAKNLIKEDEKKRLLQNPFRALEYNNPEKYGVTINNLYNSSKKLERMILNLYKEGNTFNIKDHLNILNSYFKNDFIKYKYRYGNQNEIYIVKKIYSLLINGGNILPAKMYKDDFKEAISLLLHKKNELGNQNIRDYSIEQLDGIIHNENITNYFGKNEIYITDMSYQSYKKNIDKKVLQGKILDYDDIKEILERSLEGEMKEILLEGLELRKKSQKLIESYIKYVFANLFINFNGKKEFSFINGLRKGDSESIMLKQIRSIYKNNKEAYQELDKNEKLDEKLLYKEIIECSIERLVKNNEKYPNVSYRDLDFCGEKFLYSSVLEDYPTYTSEFHTKLVFANLVGVLKNSVNNSFENITRYIFPLFPQYETIVKRNILNCEYARRNLREYKFYDGINYPKNIDSIYLLKSKYVVGEKYKIKKRYNDENKHSKGFIKEEYFKEFLKNYKIDRENNSGLHCKMCPHIYLCRKGVFVVDYR